MKAKIIFLFGFFIATCVLRREPEYILPQGLTKETKKEFLTRFDKGKALYKITCSKCHDKVVNGKTVSREFNALQLKAYSLRITNQVHSKNLTEKELSEEELNNVVYYLMYKKTNTAKK